jgi:hypothetical protein
MIAKRFVTDLVEDVVVALSERGAHDAALLQQVRLLRTRFSQKEAQFQ